VEAVTTDNVILSGLVSTSQGAFKLVGKSFTKEPYGIGIKKGDTAFCQFIDDTLKASDADGSYSAAWKATVGTVQPEVNRLVNELYRVLVHAVVATEFPRHMMAQPT
jgi:glutamate transport system substrate-binding protein